MRRFRLSNAAIIAQKPSVVLSASLLITALITYADLHTGSSIKPAILYVIPVALAAAYGSRLMGVVLALLATGAWEWADALLLRDGADVAALAWNSSTRLALFFFIVYLIVRYRDRMREMVSLAITDPLTGLANRRAFFDYLAAEVARAGRGGHPLALVYLDVDGFKRINDLYGHAAGDEVLRIIGGVLMQRMRAFDLPARLGGDEFAVLLPETTREAGEHVTSDLEARITQALSSLPYAPGVSIGLAACDKTPPGSTEQLLRQADEAMYAVKRRRSTAQRPPR